MTTRRPADEFGARVSMTAGDFNRRDAQVAVDFPITDTFQDEVHRGHIPERRLHRGFDGTLGFRFARRHDSPGRSALGALGTLFAALDAQRRDQARHGSENPPHDALRQFEDLRLQHHAGGVPGRGQCRVPGKPRQLRGRRRRRRFGRTQLLHRHGLGSAAQCRLRNPLHGPSELGIQLHDAHDRLLGRRVEQLPNGARAQ